MFSPRQLLIAFSLLLGANVSAQQLTYVPEELRPWQDWVLADFEYRDCPFYFDRAASSEADFVCTWPGPLELNVATASATFTQRWMVSGDSRWIPLPGDETYWPERVTVDGSAVSVVSRNGIPSVYLRPGSHTLAGRINWDARPRQLTVAPIAGLLRLTVDGKTVNFPQRSKSAVWISDAPEVEREQNELTVNVYRRIEDGIPATLTTVLRLLVTGEVREQVVGAVLPRGFIPVAMQSRLPARLDANGELRLQLRPGLWEIEIRARGPGVIDELVMEPPGENMPGDEIWSYSAADSLRVTVPSGPEPIDPTQAEVPRPWYELPAFRLVPGQALTIAERSRGDVAVDNRLTLDRRLWLDFSGDGYAFLDTIAGTMRSGWRLDMQRPYDLLGATAGEENLLITEGAEPGYSGIEVRDGELAIEAHGRTETREPMPVAGWSNRFDRVSASLNVPPGHVLFAAFGADHAPQAWVSRWKLLDFFLLLIVTIAAHRLFNWKVAALAFATLLLSLHESGAPGWAWLNLLAAIALIRAVPQGRFRQALGVYRTASFALLVLLAVPFLVGQIRIGLYPQLEIDRFSPAAFAVTAPADFEMDAAKMQVRTLEAVGRSAPAPGEFEEIVTYAAKRVFDRYDPDAVLQTGPGKPDWSWKTYALQWTGPVDAEDSLNLVILSRWVVSALRFVVVVLVLLLLARMAEEMLGRAFPKPWLQRSGKVAALGPLFLVMATTMLPFDVRAEVPPQQILDELRQRLLQPPECAPRCAEIVAAGIEIRGDRLDIDMTVHALDRIALALPGSEQGWRPEQVSIDSKPAALVYRDEQRRLWSLLDEGQHRILLSGPLPPVDALELPFPVPPRVVTAKADGWSVSGISERRLVSGSLQLFRQQKTRPGDEPPQWQSDRFPVFARVERSIIVGLDWTVETRVVRIAPARGAFSLEIPLLDGESIASEGYEVKDGRIRVNFAENEDTVYFESILPRKSPLTLVAPGNEVPWTERWSLRVAEAWHADFDGPPRTAIGQPEGYYTVFDPRADEILTVALARPAAVAGATIAFDDVQLDSAIGARSRNSHLSLTYRSTQGGQHGIRLPDGAEVEQVEIDGRIEPLRPIDSTLSVPILPGTHQVSIRWREDLEVGWRETTSAVDLGAAASNIRLSLPMPANRWILGTQGPSLGPAVLYWPELVALVLLALILGRIRITPLGTSQWLLLGLGFSTFSWSALGIVVAWLLVLGWRQRWSGGESANNFNLVQTGIALLSFAALLSFVSSLPLGLLGTPDMHITGNGSFGYSLQWFADRSNGLLPAASVFSVPLWVYKALILIWALWVSLALVRWLPWGWQCVSSGALWKPRPARSAPVKSQQDKD